MSISPDQSLSVPPRAVEPAGPFHTAISRTNRQTWMISFADLMAILLTFMVIAFSTKEITTVPWQKMSESMQNVFQGEGASPTLAPASGRPFTRRGASDDAHVTRLIEEVFPGSAETGGVVRTSRGVEINFDQVASSNNRMADLADLVVKLDRSMLVSVAAPLPSESPTSIQRTLAWEQGLTEAYAVRSQLMENGLVKKPRISVSVIERDKAGVILVIERVRGVAQ